MQVHAVKWPDKIKPNFEIKTKRTMNELRNTDETLWWHSIHHYFAIYMTLSLIIILAILFKRKFDLEPIP